MYAVKFICLQPVRAYFFIWKEKIKMENWIWTVVDLLMPIFGVLVSVACFYLTRWLKEKAEYAKDERLKEYLNGVVDRSTEALKNAVIATQQQLVDDLKAAHEDGKLTAEEKKLAFNNAKNLFLNMVGESGLAELKKAVENIDAWIETMIEKTVNEVGKE
jgi:hypothetical protein